MRYDKEKHHRRSIRLKDYDYSQTGAYFVTVCAWNRECLFGEIVNSEIKLSSIGEIVQKEWFNIPNCFSGIQLDTFIVMPNHIHGIINVGATLAVAQNDAMITNRGQGQALPLQKDLPPLPEGWVWTRLDEIAKINPTLNGDISGETEVTFLPMKCVEELTRHIDLSNTRKLLTVKKGYTPFMNDDIIFAKITPCMENGKIAILKNLKNGIGFGSTEFHVIRLHKKEMPRKFVFFFLLQESFRKQAQRKMTGTAGQLRVPASFMEQVIIPFPPLPEQHQIVEEIERRFSVADEVEKVVDNSLKQAERLRQSILKRAFEGKLVPQDPTDEPAERLLERIKREKEQAKFDKDRNITKKSVRSNKASAII